MTPTDRDRRNAAAELRKCRGGWSSGECYYAILHALHLPDTSREDGGHALYAALADLIDPGESGQNLDTNRDTVQKESPAVPIAPKCDREALLELADDLETYRLPISGIAVAEHIREACGVSADE